MERPSVSSAVARFWWLALAVFCLVLAVGVAAAYLPAKRYQASTTLLVQPASAADFNSSSIALIQFLLPAIPEQVQSQGFRAQLDSRLPLEMRNADVSASVAPGTGVVTVTANSKTPRTASVVANTASALVVSQSISPALKITVLNPARTPTAPASPRKKEILAAAFVLAILAGIGAALAADRIRRSRHGARQGEPLPGSSDAVMPWQREVVEAAHGEHRLPD